MMGFPFEWLTRKNKLNALYQVLTRVESTMSDIKREGEETVTAIGELRAVVAQVVARLLGMIADKDATIAGLQQGETDAVAAAAALDAQQAAIAQDITALQQVGVPVEPPPAPDV